MSYRVQSVMSVCWFQGEREVCLVLSRFLYREYVFPVTVGLRAQQYRAESDSCRLWILRGTDVFWIWASNRSLWNSGALSPSPIVKRRSMNLGKSLTCCLYQNKYTFVLMVTNVQSRLTVSPSVAMTSSLGWVTPSPPLHSGEEQKMQINELIN